jgi:lipoate synthase
VFLAMVVTPSNPVFSTKALISDLRLHTVCESAQCPNRWECWSQGPATFMIAGDRCTRLRILPGDDSETLCSEEDEAQRVAEAVRRMNLKHVVITAVARDDLNDGGADHFARTITATIQLSSRFSCLIFTRRIGASKSFSTPGPTFTITTWKRWNGSRL